MKSEVIFDISKINDNLNILRELTLKQDFWDNHKSANKILKKIKMIENEVNFYNSLEDQYNFLDLYIEELSTNEKITSDYIDELNNFSKNIEKLEIRTLLNEKDDNKDVILSIHPGAGGKESQDWTFMLYRMYIRWAENNNLSYNVLNYQDGDETGIKDVSIEIKGINIYGQLKSERGIHRLVRISPFDSNSKRHTSFAAVYIDPILDDDINIEIDDKDIKIDTYRASGAGGQHVNKTDSAVRIKHIPSGIVVQCQNERSQLKNKNMALKMLKSKLYQNIKEEEEKKKNIENSQKMDIAWGSQIRSYIFHPYNLVKDHRSNYENSNVSAIMDGRIDAFIRNFLLLKMENNNE